MAPPAFRIRDAKWCRLQDRRHSARHPNQRRQPGHHPHRRYLCRPGCHHHRPDARPQPRRFVLAPMKKVPVPKPAQPPTPPTCRPPEPIHCRCSTRPQQRRSPSTIRDAKKQQPPSCAAAMAAFEKAAATADMFSRLLMTQSDCGERQVIENLRLFPSSTCLCTGKLSISAGSECI
jgi:hypothetical protein